MPEVKDFCLSGREDDQASTTEQLGALYSKWPEHVVGELFDVVGSNHATTGAFGEIQFREVPLTKAFARGRGPITLVHSLLGLQYMLRDAIGSVVHTCQRILFRENSISHGVRGIVLVVRRIQRA